jgi:tRNA(fMet)-specific endonuclease VapC
MRYLLDTNICIAIINSRSPHALKRLSQCTVGDVAVSCISIAELRFGAAKSESPERNNSALDLFLSPLLALEFDDTDAMRYGQIRATLEAQGTPIGPLDTLIAAQSAAKNLTLVTNNTREFKRVQQIRFIENWLNEDTESYQSSQSKSE